MRETEHFVNDGYGWACRHCRALEDSNAPADETKLARFFREGEAEERDTRLAANALARWTDDSRRALRCTHCGVEEEIGG